VNIGIVTTWFERGAAYVSRQYRDVLESRHRVFIYARGGEFRAVNDPRWDDPRVTWGKPSVMPVESAVDLEDFEEWIRKNEIQAVLFNEQRWWDPVILCSQLGVLSGAYIDYYTQEMVPLFGCYDFLICNTRRHHSVFDWHPQASYVPWGTDLTVFQPRATEAVRPGSVTFFHSAGMNPVRKGTDFVIEAFRQLDHPTARLVIHTQAGFSGISHLEPIARQLQSDGRLELRAETVSAPGLYHLGDVYVYPSRLDGVGLTVAEALACGLPTIVPDEAPMNEFVTAESGARVRVASRAPRDDGYYWPMCFVDMKDLTTCLREYADASDADIAALKRGAYEHARTALDWKRNASGLPELLEQFKPFRGDRQQGAIEQALQFERARAGSSPRNWMSYHFPGVVGAARNVFRSLRPTKQHV
jgi:glycosyltransferase involved in cell wall biosynthesis